ncbi:MAG: competence/damage-inducible protein A [Desulfitobacteriia bacterium]|jgi:nicotinamide-nucleotide amidase
MKAEIISTGTELLLGKTLNTSAFYITAQLSGLGIEVVYHTTVGDHRERLLGAVRQALTRSELVVLTGGLGPTKDDLTKEIVALALGLELEYDRESMEAIKSFYKREKLPPQSGKQAFFPKGAKILPNTQGTAPGAFLEKDGKYCVILPGPPSEMRPMFDKYVRPELSRLTENNKEKQFTRVLKVFGLSESELEQKLSDLTLLKSPFLTLLDQHTYIEVRITIRSDHKEKALQELTRLEEEIRQRLGTRVFGLDEETQAQVVGELLKSKKMTLATAESCTGGLLGGKITSTAGSSEYYIGGVVSYANSVKENLLGVSRVSLTQKGAVSEQVAMEMAEGARRVLKADFALSITGIAGPQGDTPDKPLGLVYIALAHSEGVRVSRHLFTGDRESVRNMAVESALNTLRLFLLEG